MLAPKPGGDEFDRLKTLLFRPEANRIADIESTVSSLDQRVGTPDRLERATAEVLVDALRRAEVAQHRELSRAIAPVVVAAIRNEIKNSRDMMVEALYPITGRLVSAGIAVAMAELAASINARMDSLMSMRGLQLRFQAWRTGRPFSELAMAQAQRGRLVRLLYLERGSGLLLGEWQSQAARDDRADLISGMIAALTDFARNALGSSGGELRTLDLGGNKIYLRTSAQMIVAAEYAGPLQADQERALDAGFLDLLDAHEQHGQPAGQALEDLAERLRTTEQSAARPRWRPSPLLVLTLIALAIVSWFGYRSLTRWRLEARVDKAVQRVMATRPELAAFPMRLETRHSRQQVTLHALLPDAAAQAQLEDALRPAAAPYALSAAVEFVTPQSSAARLVENVAALTSRLQSVGAELTAAEERLQTAQAGLTVRMADSEKATVERLTALDSGVQARIAETEAQWRRDLVGTARRSDETAAALAARIETEAQKLAAASASLSEKVEAEAGARQLETATLAQAGAVRAVEVETSLQRGLADVSGRLDRTAEELRALDAAAEGRRREQNAALERRQAQTDEALAAARARLDAPRARLLEALRGFAVFFEDNDQMVDETNVRARLAEIVPLARMTGGLRVNGHSDNKGTDARNQTVSRQRAEAVARLLTELGLDRQKIVLASHANSMPIHDKDGLERRNRRVVLEPLFENELPP